MHFVKDHEGSRLRLDQHITHKGQGQEELPVGEVCQQPQAVCKSVQVRIPKDSLQKTHPVQVWPDSQGNDREAELNSRQI